MFKYVQQVNEMRGAAAMCNGSTSGGAPGAAARGAPAVKPVGSGGSVVVLPARDGGLAACVAAEARLRAQQRYVSPQTRSQFRPAANRVTGTNEETQRKPTYAT